MQHRRAPEKWSLRAIRCQTLWPGPFCGGPIRQIAQCAYGPAGRCAADKSIRNTSRTRQCIDPVVGFGAMTGARRSPFTLIWLWSWMTSRGCRPKPLQRGSLRPAAWFAVLHPRDREGIKHEIVRYEGQWVFREFFRRAKDPPGATPLAIRRAFGSGRVQLSPAAPGIPGGPQHFVDTANG